ncbi:MAG: hypothetical protein ACFFBD_10840 [Candidatus Hodarchaeota archaeon]
MKIMNWGLFEITRKEVQFSRVYGIENNPKLLARILPYGIPVDQTIKFVIEDKINYLSYLEMQESVPKGIIFVFNSSNPLEAIFVFIPKMTDVLRNPPSTESTLELDVEERVPKPVKITNLDKGIFSILASLPVVILGESKEILNILNMLFYSFPVEIRQKFTFVSQSSSLSENVRIIGMPYTEETSNKLDQEKGKFTIFHLGDRVYGEHSSQLCKKIALLIQEGEYEQSKNILADFYQLIQESDELPSALEFSRQYNLHLSNAQLALMMRANHFGKAIPKELLE